MSRTADVAEETDPGGACPEDASVLLGDELAQSENGRVHTSVSKTSPSLCKNDSISAFFWQKEEESTARSLSLGKAIWKTRPFLVQKSPSVLNHVFPS